MDCAIFGNFFSLALLSHSDLRYFMTSPDRTAAYVRFMEFVFSDPVDLSSSKFTSWICQLENNLLANLYILFFLLVRPIWLRDYLSLFDIILYLQPSFGLPIMWPLQVQEAYKLTNHVKVVSMTRDESAPAPVRASRCSLIAQPHHPSLSAHTPSHPTSGQRASGREQSPAVPYIQCNSSLTPKDEVEPSSPYNDVDPK
jgi:hypothetical protein